MNSFSSSMRNQHPHYGLDPGKREEKRRRKRRKAASSQLFLKVWNRAGRRRSAGKSGGRRLRLPAAALSSFSKNQHSHYGLGRSRKEKKHRKERKKAAMSTSSSTLGTRFGSCIVSAR